MITTPAIALAALLLAQNEPACPKYIQEHNQQCYRNLIESYEGPGGQNFGGRTRYPTPSPSTTLTWMYDGSPAWLDLPGSVLLSPPQNILYVPTIVPQGVLSAGTKIRFSCPEAANIEICDAWVWFYSCDQSCSNEYQGGLGLYLAGNGWEHTRCGPQFTTGVASGYRHQMAGYRLHLEQGEEVNVTLPNNAEFVAFGLDDGATDCGQFFDDVECEEVPANRCVWSEGECIASRCRGRNRGPPPPCTECPWQGLDARDPSKGPYSGVQPNGGGLPGSPPSGGDDPF